MTTKNRIATTVAASLIALLASTAATAQVYGDTGGYNVPELQAPATKTRAQVNAELAQAVANGELRTNAQGYYSSGDRAPAAATATAGKTRDEVRAEVIKAIQAGEHLSQGSYSRG